MGRVNANDGVLFLFPKAIIALLSLIDYIGIIIFFDAKRNQVAFLFTDCTHSSFLKTHAPIPPTAHAVGFLGAGFVKELSGESTLSIKRLASCCGDFPKLREPLFLYAVFSGQLQTLRSALQAESNESLQKLCDDFGDIVMLDILQKKAVYLWALSEENAEKPIPKPFSANGIVAKPGRIVTLIRLSLDFFSLRAIIQPPQFQHWESRHIFRGDSPCGHFRSYE
jgi:hypothetical protein